MEDRILQLVEQANPNNPLQYVRSIVKEYANEKLIEHIKLDKPNEFKTIPHGNVNASIMIIGGTPENELLENTYALTEESASYVLGAVLNNILEVREEELYYINMMNTWTYKGETQKVFRVPTTSEISDSRLFVDQAIEIVQPLAIILLGAVALNAYDSEKSLLKSRGEWTKVKGIPTMVTYSPDYFEKMKDRKDSLILEENKQEFISDISKVIEYIESNYPNLKIKL